MKLKLVSLLPILLFANLCFAAVSNIWSPTVIVASGDMEQTTITSTAMDLTYVQQYSVQAVYTGSPVGTFKLQLSNDNAPCSSAVNWTDYSSSSQAISAAGNYAWNVSFSNYHCVRLVYTRDSGSGTLTAIFGSK